MDVGKRLAAASRRPSHRRKMNGRQCDVVCRIRRAGRASGPNFRLLAGAVSQIAPASPPATPPGCTGRRPTTGTSARQTSSSSRVGSRIGRAFQGGWRVLIARKRKSCGPAQPSRAVSPEESLSCACIRPFRSRSGDQTFHRHFPRPSGFRLHQHGRIVQRSRCCLKNAGFRRRLTRVRTRRHAPVRSRSDAQGDGW